MEECRSLYLFELKFRFTTYQTFKTMEFFQLGYDAFKEIIRFLTKKSETRNVLKRNLFREIRDNLKLLEHFDKKGIDFSKIILNLSNAAIEQAINKDFHFNNLSKAKLTEAYLHEERGRKYIGWDCDKLLMSIDGKISELKKLPNIYKDISDAPLNPKLRLSNLLYQLQLLSMLIRTESGTLPEHKHGASPEKRKRMQVFKNVDDYVVGERTVATIGTFDGVHLGHKRILSQLLESARSKKGESLVISFHPHPRLALKPQDSSLKLLHTLEEKINSLEKLGIDKLLLIPFTPAFAQLSSEEFIKKILVEKLKIYKIVIGYDHRFGKNRDGGLQALLEAGKQYGFSVEEIPAKKIDAAEVSSTAIRAALAEGDLEKANRYLGYRYSLQGNVITGNKLGRTIGFPTANL